MFNPFPYTLAILYFDGSAQAIFHKDKYKKTPTIFYLKPLYEEKNLQREPLIKSENRGVDI